MGLFKKLTTDEMDVLGDHLRSGWTKQNKVTKDNDMFFDTADVLDSIEADRRDRWNAEHPGHKY